MCSWLPSSCYKDCWKMVTFSDGTGIIELQLPNSHFEDGGIFQPNKVTRKVSWSTSNPSRESFLCMASIPKGIQTALYLPKIWNIMALSATQMLSRSLFFSRTLPPHLYHFGLFWWVNYVSSCWGKTAIAQRPADTVPQNQHQSCHLTFKNQDYKSQELWGGFRGVNRHKHHC